MAEASILSRIASNHPEDLLERPQKEGPVSMERCGACGTMPCSVGTPEPQPAPETEPIDHAHAHVETMVAKADGFHGPAPWWYGWAIRDAFMAGWRAALSGERPDPPKEGR